MRENLEEAWVHSRKAHRGHKANDFLLWNVPSLKIQLSLQYGVIFQQPRGFKLIFVEKPQELDHVTWSVTSKCDPCMLVGCVNLKMNIVSILTTSTSWPGKLEATSWCARRKIIYIDVLFQSFVSRYVLPEREEGDVPACGGMGGAREGGGSQGTQRNSERDAFIPETTYSASHLLFLLLLRQRKKYDAQRELFHSLPQPNLLLAGSAQEPFFCSNGLWEFSGWPRAECLSSEVDRGSPPCRSPHSLLHLLRLSDSKGERGWGTRIRLWVPQEAVTPRGERGPTATVSQSFVGHLTICVIFTQALPLRIPNAIQTY